MASVKFETIPIWKDLTEEVLWYKGETFQVALAKLKELENLSINVVYDEVDDEKQAEYR